MKSVCFEWDQQLRYVAWADGAGYYGVGQGHVTSIRVIFEAGQCGGVPWALVEFSSKPPCKVNPLQMEEVGYLNQDMQ